MTQEQIEMLKRSLSGVDLLLCNQEEKAIVRFLISQGLCEKPVALNQTVIYTSEAGKAYLHSQEQILEQQAKNERQQRFDNKISVLSVLIPLITFIIGVLIEHWVGLIDSFRSLLSINSFPFYPASFSSPGNSKISLIAETIFGALRFPVRILYI